MSLADHMNDRDRNVLDDVDATIERITELGGYVAANGQQWTVQCPHPDHLDRNPSASLRRGEHGQAIFHCFACSDSNSREWVTQVRVRLEGGELFATAKPRGRSGSGGAARGSVTDTYEYQTRTGQPCQKVRYVNDAGSKTFTWRRPYGESWVDGLGVGLSIDDLHLYRASEIPEVGRLLWVEGEKDADRLHAAGFPAVTTAGGAAGPIHGDLERLRGLTVVVIADRDAAGLQYAQRVTDALDGITADTFTAVTTLDLPGGDVSDHLDAGLDVNEMDVLVPEHPPTIRPDGKSITFPTLTGTDEPEPEPEPEPVGDSDAPPIEDAVFTHSPELAYIRELARARMLSPWAVLGAFIGRATAQTSPNLTVPAFVGAPASLNQIIALTGPSGSGKSATGDVAAETFPLTVPVNIANPSSGEGLVSLFVDVEKGVSVQTHTRAMSVIDEITQLGAQQSRNGSTLAAVLRSAWSGSLLSTFAADKDRRRRLEPGSYRYVLLCGVQETTASVFLDDHAAGTPQRVLWMPATDPHMPDHTPPEPASNPFTGWRLPSHGPHIEYPPHVAEHVQENRRARIRGDGHALDGHHTLTRLKVAAGIALLHRTTTVTDEMWNVSGHVMQISDRTRATIETAIAAAASSRAEAAGIADSQREEAKTQRSVTRAALIIGRYVHKHPTPDGGFTRKQIKSATGPHKNRAAEAITHAIAEGYLTASEVDHHGQTGHRYFPGEVKP